jgi:hypothetical protein
MNKISALIAACAAMVTGGFATAQVCETDAINGCTASSPIVVSIAPLGRNFPPNHFDITNDGTGGSDTAFMSLNCINVGVVRNIFKGPVTQGVVGLTQKNCGVPPNQNFPIAFNSTCGASDTCDDF